MVRIAGPAAEALHVGQVLDRVVQGRGASDAQAVATDTPWVAPGGDGCQLQELLHMSSQDRLPILVPHEGLVLLEAGGELFFQGGRGLNGT